MRKGVRYAFSSIGRPGSLDEFFRRLHPAHVSPRAGSSQRSDSRPAAVNRYHGFAVPARCSPRACQQLSSRLVPRRVVAVALGQAAQLPKMAKIELRTTNSGAGSQEQVMRIPRTAMVLIAGMTVCKFLPPLRSKHAHTCCTRLARTVSSPKGQRRPQRWNTGGKRRRSGMPPPKYDCFTSNGSAPPADGEPRHSMLHTGPACGAG
jgi:hypothetical protein